MKKKLTGYSSTLLLTLIAFSQVALGSTLQNGSFESGDFTGWTSAGNVKVSAFGGGASVPSEGFYGALFNGGDKSPNGEISQSFTANIGATYVLVFDFAKGGVGSGTAALNVRVQGTELLVDEIINDSTGGKPGAYSSYVFSFTADSTSLTLSFTDNSGGGGIAFDAALDNISITSTTTPFAEFIPSTTHINFGGIDKPDHLFFTGYFSLADASDGISLAQDTVTLNAGPVAIEIPAGSFQKCGTQYFWEGTVDGARIKAAIKQYKAALYSFSFQVHEVDLTGWSNPEQWGLKIGNDFGTTTKWLKGHLQSENYRGQKRLRHRNPNHNHRL